jgi:hypothetical protein
MLLLASPLRRRRLAAPSNYQPRRNFKPRGNARPVILGFYLTQVLEADGPE